MAKDTDYEIQLGVLENQRKIMRQRFLKFEKMKADVMSDNERLIKSAIELKGVMNQQEDSLESVRRARGRKGDTNRIKQFERDLINVKRLVGHEVDSLINKRS